MSHQVRVTGTFFVSRKPADKRLILRGEEVRGRAENLRRTATEHDVLGLDPLLLGDRLDEVASRIRVPPGCAATVSERALDGVQDLFSGSDGVFVAGEDDESWF